MEESVIPVPIPPLASLLAALEAQKGAPLTEEEVLHARDNAICLNMAVSRARRLAEMRGWDDIDPDNVWEEWQQARQD